jgi:hypothetical protein
MSSCDYAYFGPSNGDLALTNPVHLPEAALFGLGRKVVARPVADKQVRLRDTSGEVAINGILPGESTKFPVLFRSI